MRKKFFDSQANRLVYVDREATQQFWDEKWEEAASATFANPPRHGATVRTTLQYLKPGSRVLEGGCGLGDVVHALHKAGYQVEGIDYAPRVVSAIKSRWPHLNVSMGDVRQLGAPDGSYDGYWSIGVIEHFADGYEAVAQEMRRVIRPGGYLFLSFPAFNSFRQWRAAGGKYNRMPDGRGTPADFYQYALDPRSVATNFESLGFKLVERRGIDSLMCLSEDCPAVETVRRTMTRLPPRFGTGIGMAIDLLVGRYAGHSALLIFKR
jgi:SAM-dependent methyltransferase